MKRNYITALAVCYALSTSGLAIYAHEQGYFKPRNTDMSKNQAVGNKTNIKSNDKNINTKEVYGTVVHKEAKDVTDNSSKEKKNSSNKSVQAPLTRGGDIDRVQGKTQEKSTKVELLDWWREAQFVFSVGTEAVVRDVDTGKTFKIVRTMGTNHADCEAATKQDTQIIKEIWGGFSWDRRSVQITVGGRVLAASMAGMPHAGIDAVPAYNTVSNRAGGYGRGENLDVIKGNGMDGHFDVHFLNSKTHGTSRVDQQHQACVKRAAEK